MGLESAKRLLEDAEALPAALRDAFLERARPMKVRRGQIVTAEDDDSNEVYLIRSGKVQVSLVSSQGREIILRDLRTGQIVGEMAVIDGGPRSANIIAIEDSLLARVRGEEFLDLLSAPGAGLWMSRLLAARVRDLTERAFELATLPVAARVHKELFRLAVENEASDDHVLIRAMPRHADVAARIGTHREAVTRELNLLAADGILRQRGRQIEILSVKRLRALHERMRQ